MQGIIKQLEACHIAFKSLFRDGSVQTYEDYEESYENALEVHRALIDRLKSIPTWHMSVGEMAAMLPEAPDREATMREWDKYAAMLRGGDVSSLPRDWFENLLDTLGGEFTSHYGDVLRDIAALPRIGDEAVHVQIACAMAWDALAAADHAKLTPEGE